MTHNEDGVLCLMLSSLVLMTQFNCTNACPEDLLKVKFMVNDHPQFVCQAMPPAMGNSGLESTEYELLHLSFVSIQNLVFNV